MVIAFNRIGRFKRWIGRGIVGFFRGIKNGIVRAIRGPRGGNGSGSGGADIIALEVTDAKDFQVMIHGVLNSAKRARQRSKIRTIFSI